MNNQEFLNCISQSFKKFLVTHSRSNQKLVILHGGIAKDLSLKLGEEYQIKSLGYGNGKESKIEGRYLNKNVDITILKNNQPIAGIGVKFVMQNYSQNSVNYFENMLGETANIRSNHIPYFQIFIIPDKLPYYEDGGKLKHWETFSLHNAKKYLALSNDNVEQYYHSPIKTLLLVINLPDIQIEIKNKIDYTNFYNDLETINIKVSEFDYGKFNNSVIINDYEEYIRQLSKLRGSIP
jgi:hypothetical protein